MIAKYLRVFTHRTHIASFYRFTSDYQNEIITQLKLVKLDKGGDIYSNGYVQNLKILEDG